MRAIAAAMIVLALPCAAHAQFTSQPMPQTRYRAPPIDGRAGTAPAPRELDRADADIQQPREGPRLPTVEGRASPGFATVSDELDRARRDIERRRDRGELSRREARALRREASRIDAMADRYRQGGFSEFERRELEVRASELRNRTATGRHS